MVAYTALFLWPLVMIMIFKRRPPVEALIWSVVGAYLLLPIKTGINLPALPSINKGTLPIITALLLLTSLLRKQNQPYSGRGSNAPMALDMTQVLPGWLPQSRIIRALIVLFFVGIPMTVLTNGDMKIYGDRVLPPLSFYDILSTTSTGIMGLLPILLARKFLGHPDAHATLLKVLCISGLLYSLPAFFEIRMSPRLNLMVYGFQAKSWLQGARGDGWRPTIFLEHGLVVGLFFAMALLAAVGYMRISDKKRLFLWLFAVVWLLLTVTLMNSLGALMIAVALLPAALLLNARLQMIFAAIFAIIVLSYPLLRSADLVPTDQIISFAKGIDQERAGSLAFRIANEEVLLDHARDRPLFGWGGWARSRVFNERGQDISVTDGVWVIYLGVGGWAEYLYRFGLLGIPIIVLAFRRRGDPVNMATSALSIVMVANLVDMIPNSANTPITSLICGALIGRMEYERIKQPNALQTDTEPHSDSHAIRYARRGPMSRPPDAT